jgi:hypothetical protein
LETVQPVAARSLSALNNVVEAYQKAGRLKVVDLDFHTIVVLIWTRVHGLISVEISNNLPPITQNNEQLFQIEFNLILDQFFIN